MDNLPAGSQLIVSYIPFQRHLLSILTIPPIIGTLRLLPRRYHARSVSFASLILRRRLKPRWQTSSTARAAARGTSRSPSPLSRECTAPWSPSACAPTSVKWRQGPRRASTVTCPSPCRRKTSTRVCQLRRRWRGAWKHTYRPRRTSRLDRR